MSAIVHTFPSFHGVNVRSFALAFIVLLHVAFFWALSSGMKVPIQIPFTRSEIVKVPDERRPPPPEIRRSVDDVSVIRPTPTDMDEPVIPMDDVLFRSDLEPVIGDAGSTATDEPVTAAPVLVQPQIPQSGLREPTYPAAEIRLNHTGTVWLDVEVLASGRIGAVRLLRSSGYPKLDAAALSVAREWQMVPGTRDGVAAPMWKQIPITFRLTR